MRAVFTVPILLLAAAAAFAEDPLVVLAASRTGRIEFFDARLGALGVIGVKPQLESVTASPDGHRLYIAQESEWTRNTCCGLYSLDLETRSMCFVAAPALFGAPSPDGNYLFTQGDRGVDVFDRALNRLPTMKAPGAYNLQPSPDGQWLLGITNAPKLSSLDIFDLKARALVRRLPISPAPVTGAWAGDRFYLFAYSAHAGRGTGWLWNVRPEDTELAPGRIQLPDLHGGCHEPVLLMLAGAPDRLFVAEAFGFKVDRRLACPDAARGGVYVIQPSTGHVGLLAESVYVNRMAVTPDGRDLFALQSGGLGGNDLVHVDTRNGNMYRIELPSGDWNLALAHIPPALIPRGYVRAAVSGSR